VVRPRHRISSTPPLSPASLGARADQPAHEAGVAGGIAELECGRLPPQSTVPTVGRRPRPCRAADPAATLFGCPGPASGRPCGDEAHPGDSIRLRKRAPVLGARSHPTPSCRERSREPSSHARDLPVGLPRSNTALHRLQGPGLVEDDGLQKQNPAGRTPRPTGAVIEQAGRAS